MEKDHLFSGKIHIFHWLSVPHQVGTMTDAPEGCFSGLLTLAKSLDIQ